jgi:glycine/D-amino acid oxidase-like deaminating enzyme
MQDSASHPCVDVLIVGGGVMGASLATWLRLCDPTVSVALIERDPTWASASSALSAASIRQQFTTAVNIEISRQSLALLRTAGDWLAVEGDRPDLGFHEGGYLVLAGEEGAPVLRQAHAIQQAHAADVGLLSPAQLRGRFPWLNVADLQLGSLGFSGEGWFDGYRLLSALTAKARHLGVHMVRGEVVAMQRDGRSVSRVVLADGREWAAGVVVNAAGPWARAVASLAGLDVPVAACRRTVFVLDCPTPLPSCPLLVDTSGFWLRPDGPYFIGGVVPPDDVADLPLEPDLAQFEDLFWPALAHRIPAFEALKVVRAWAGYYEMNTFDHNGLVGLHPDADNVYLMNGFSGHGIQQAPAVGRALAERIVTGAYRTLDLTALSPSRIPKGSPLTELAIIG